MAKQKVDSTSADIQAIRRVWLSYGTNSTESGRTGCGSSA
jgi:hypothetical protein